MNSDSPARSGGLVLDHLYVAQGNSTLLDALHVTVQPGQCLAVQCNHVTGQLIMNVLAGTAAMSTGTVSWNGLPLHSPEAKSRISWIRQEDAVHERLTVREAVGLYMKLYNAFDKSRLESVLKLTGLWNKQNVRLGKCTEAEQRRFQLARAAAVKPELIIMEDPEFHLDLESCFLLRQWTRELCQEGIAFFMTVPSLESALTLTDTVLRWTPAGFKEVILDEDGSSQAAEGTAVLPQEAADDRSSAEAAPSAAKKQADGSLASESDTAAGGSPSTADAADGAGTPPGSQRHYPQIVFDKVPARVEDKIVLIDPLEMIYIESQDGVAHLHVQSGEYPCSMTLQDLEQKLKPFGFFRCHRSYLVNLQRVREVIIWSRNSYSLVLDDEKKSTVPLSKTKYEDMKAIMGIS
ncbi:LytTR family transcriptional regulator DNA-binding domain-containing protein [Paenibacillus dendritiformis]|uniref:LytTr DNA-binding protein n=1 Tax=Paenibacillus dendritiformis C454 TaxID=1131935 RepID=H3SGA0_9BACL|nr:LytTR family transcriptional regulator DNA-binding domain-containing protein [Paenibacillus dendritiformis]EHQ61910.1 LytTr DNA-binding protein [Paenibacillus dendritiformis C454]CAH8767567.1 LytTR family transcriptional regulator DNA-binding domain-containing protein [Paenibacillus dendritiformis]